MERAEKRRRPVDAVEEAHQHALLGPHLQRLQHLRERFGPLAQLPVGPRSARVDIGDPFGPAVVTLKDVACEIIGPRNGSSPQTAAPSRHSLASPGMAEPLWRRRKTAATRPFPGAARSPVTGRWGRRKGARRPILTLRYLPHASAHGRRIVLPGRRIMDDRVRQISAEDINPRFNWGRALRRSASWGSTSRSASTTAGCTAIG